MKNAKEGNTLPHPHKLKDFTWQRPLLTRRGQKARPTGPLFARSGPYVPTGLISFAVI